MLADQPPPPPRPPVVAVETRGRIGGNDVRGRMTLPGYDGRISIDVRGGWSRNFPKRSYNVELQEPDGDNRNEPLLGMPADDDWVLYAAYNDRTLIRNVLAYDTARRVGRYAARSRFVELRLNGGYRGVYVLMEKPKVLRERVAAGDGGFLLEWTSRGQARRPGQGPSFRAPLTGVRFLWTDPDREDLTPSRARSIRAQVARAERAIYRGAPGAWRRHLHAPAAVDHLLLNELFKNQDALLASTFLWARRGGLLQFGPVWDFDFSTGFSRWGPARVLPGWMLAERPWAERLYEDRAFGRAMARRWHQLRRRGLRQRLLGQIRAHERTLAAAARRDSRRWPPSADRPSGSRAAHLRDLRGWLLRRIAWLDDNVQRLGRAMLPGRLTSRGHELFTSAAATGGSAR